MPTSYATIQDYYTFIGEAMPNPLDAAEQLRLDALIVRASGMILRRARLARISYDATTGLPKNDIILDAFMRATCATLNWWEENGDPSGALSQFDAVGMGDVSYSKRASAQSTATQSTSRIAPEAIEILMTAGIFSTRVSG